MILAGWLLPLADLSKCANSGKTRGACHGRRGCAADAADAADAAADVAARVTTARRATNNLGPDHSALGGREGKARFGLDENVNDKRPGGPPRLPNFSEK